MKRDLELEALLVEKYAAVSSVLDERGRRLWAAAESRAIGYGGDSVVSSATGLSRRRIRAGRQGSSLQQMPEEAMGTALVSGSISYNSLPIPWD